MTNSEHKSVDPEQSSISHGDKQIPCLQYGKSPPTLIFTHGAGGTLHSAAMVNFCTGFSSSSQGLSGILTFKGNMNLNSRVKMFAALIDHQSKANGQRQCLALGGRSMGARAAVVAHTETTELLVLASYPLVNARGEVRDEILLGIPEHVKVLFVSGSQDSMCDGTQLRRVRKNMRCQTWFVSVRGANHGMEVGGKKRTRCVGECTGRVAAEWLRGQEEGGRECEIWYQDDGDGDGGVAVRSEWVDALNLTNKKRVEGGEKGKRDKQTINATAPAKRLSKRKKPDEPTREPRRRSNRLKSTTSSL